jgi:hypothetical protein
MPNRESPIIARTGIYKPVVWWRREGRHPFHPDSTQIFPSRHDDRINLQEPPAEAPDPYAVNGLTILKKWGAKGTKGLQCYP